MRNHRDHVPREPRVISRGPSGLAIRWRIDVICAVSKRPIQQWTAWTPAQRDELRAYAEQWLRNRDHGHALAGTDPDCTPHERTAP